MLKKQSHHLKGLTDLRVINPTLYPSASSISIHDGNLNTKNNKFQNKINDKNPDRNQAIFYPQTPKSLY